MTTVERTHDLDASELRASLRGELIQPGDASYEEARKVYNGMIDRRPALIVRCADVADVIAAVNFARECNLLVSIRSGGHNAGGLGVCDDGLVIDLSRIRYTHVHPVAGTVRVGAGCTWGDVDHATHAYGLAVPSGIISTTGVGGLTLGGGIGYLTRKYGLAIDNLLAADVVLADGRLVTADKEQNADLFWALRGGGGNFGVVTSFLFQAHPVHTLYAGPMLWEMEQAAEVMRWYGEFITHAPDDLNGFFAFLIVPPGPPFPEHLHNKNMCGVVWCYTGPLEQAEAAFQPIRAKFPPALDFVGPLPHPALQGMFDALYAPGLQWYWKADFVDALSDEAINDLHRARLAPADAAIHHAPLSSERRGGARGTGRDSLELPRRDLGRGHRGRRSRSGEQGAHRRVGQAILGRRASLLGWRRVRELHDG